MKKHLKYIEGNSDKFWQITVQENSFTVTYGKNGTAGTSQTKQFTDAEECLKAAEKLYNEKVKKGYSESGEVVISETSSKKSTSKTPDKQELLNSYDQILKTRSISALLPYLQTYAKGNVELLKKHIKGRKRFYMTYVDLSKEPEYQKDRYQWGTRGDDKQKDILTLSAIAIFNKADLLTWEEVFDQLTNAKEPKVLEILHWAKPTWIAEFLLDRLRKNEWRNMPYLTLRFLEDEKLIDYTPELYARSISQFNHWSGHMKMPAYIDFIVNDKLAYERDVPNVFDYESNLHNQHFRVDDNAPYDQYYTWDLIFKQLLENNKLSRAHFITQSILLQTKEWNNNLKSFFRKRLAELAITPEELLPNQEQLFSCLQYPYPPVVNWATDYLKKIYEQADFDVVSFLDWLGPLMMSSDHKSSIKSLIPLLEKVVKKQPKLAPKITSLMADVYTIPDLSLQERVTKALLKVALPTDEDLRDKLSSYTGLMLGNTQNLLADYLQLDMPAIALQENAIPYQYQPKARDVLTTPLTYPKDWNEVLFLFGKFISSDEVADTELLINTLITQRHLFPIAYEKQLAPYLQQLEKKYFDSIHKAYTSTFLQQKIVSYHASFRVNVSDYHKIKTLLSIRPILYSAQILIDNNLNQPLLCFPTHLPHWVAPKVLLERLITRVKLGIAIDKLDLSIAISRMPREQTAAALPLLDQLSGDLKDLMTFCLGANKEIKLKPQGLFKKLLGKVSGLDKENIDGVWAQAARTFYPQETFEEFYNSIVKDVPFAIKPYRPKITIIERWNEYRNYATKQMERSAWRELSYENASFVAAPPYFLYGQDATGTKNSWNYFLESEGNVAYWHSLMPQNNDPLAWYLLRSSCITATGGAGNDMRGFLNIVNSPNFSFSELSMLTFACICFQEKKEVRLMASEVLVNLVEGQNIDILAFANKIAFLVYHKYGPFSRMVESTEALKDFSGLHQMAYLQMVEGILERLKVGDKLPTNFKKMAEHYVDVLYRTKQKPAAQTIAFFEHWKDNSSLKTLVKQILA